MVNRVFIGIKVPKRLYPEIQTWRKNYQGKIPVRFIKDENLHITLIPPWYVNPSQIKKIISKIDSSLVGLKPFTLSFNIVKFGPYEKKPRLIWAEGEVVEEIINLKKFLEKILGVMPEKRDFKLHLTLARFRLEQFHKFPFKKIEDKVSWKMNVKSFCLFESKLSSHGADYQVLKKFKLNSS